MIKSHFLFEKLCTINHKKINLKDYTILVLVIMNKYRRET